MNRISTEWRQCDPGGSPESPAHIYHQLQSETSLFFQSAPALALGRPVFSTILLLSRLRDARITRYLRYNISEEKHRAWLRVRAIEVELLAFAHRSKWTM